MTRLTHGALQNVHRSIRDIYSVLDAESLQRMLPAAASRLMPSGITTFCRIYQEEQNVVGCSIASVNPLNLMHVFNRHIHEHPYVNLLHLGKLKAHPFREDIIRAIRRQLPSFKRTPVLSVVKISDVLKDRQFRALALFNEFFRPNGIDYQMGIPLICGGDYHTVLHVNRDKIDFSEEERLILGLLGPHIIQAFKNADRYERARKTLQGRPEVCWGTALQSLGLTVRQADVLFWVAQGKTNTEAAAILNIAPGTVKIHLERIYQKLGVENRVSAAMTAVQAIVSSRDVSPQGA